MSVLGMMMTVSPRSTVLVLVTTVVLPLVPFSVLLVLFSVLLDIMLSEVALMVLIKGRACSTRSEEVFAET